jgi:hypothetical protein
MQLQVGGQQQPQHQGGYANPGTNPGANPYTAGSAAEEQMQ